MHCRFPNSFLARTALALTLLAGPSFGQLVVDPSGTGTFTTLQSAIDASGAGDTISVRGGVHEPVTVPHSLNIIGDPSFEIFIDRHFRTCGLGAACQAHGITLEGAGAARLTLANAVIQGQTGSLFGESGAGIAGGGFEEVWLESCMIAAPVWTAVTGVTPTVAAVDVPGRLVVVRSTVIGQDSTSDGCYGLGESDGGPAVRSQGTVEVMDSTLIGGSGTFVCFNFGMPSVGPCPCNGGGRGGAAVVAPRLFASNSTLQGGVGAPVAYLDPLTFQFIPWGMQADGAEFVGFDRVDLSSGFLSSSVAIGSIWSVRHLCQGVQGLFFGFPLEEPISLGTIGWLFLDLGKPFATAWVPLCGAVLLDIPNDGALLGLKVVAQEFNASGLARPHLAALIL